VILVAISGAGSAFGGDRTEQVGRLGPLIVGGTGALTPSWPSDRCRTQTFLWALGIDIAFTQEGRTGSRIIRIRATQETTVSTVSSVCHQSAPRPAGDVCDDSRSQPLTMLTVLTQMPAFISVNRSEYSPTSADGRLRRPGRPPAP
jgi:hypothetical protein